MILRSVAGSRFSDFRATLGSRAAPVGIGRSRSNKIIIDDPSVSSIHAAVTLSANSSVVLADLGSSNGTFVNGVLIASGDRSIIRTGDRLRFGEVEVMVEIHSQ
jgi:pSer/pThr/pTyr-binding forkhead associated (FHA) protein